MENNAIIDLRKEFESLPVEALKQLLQEETEKQIPDDDRVLALLYLLEERNAQTPRQLSPYEKESWNRYQIKARKRGRTSPRPMGALVKAASLVLILGLLFAALPQTAQADSFWDRLVRLTGDVLDFFGPKDNEHRLVEYEFKTDNPGLQELYDTVVELGVTNPVVPMWLPETGDMLECKTVQTPVKTTVAAFFPYRGKEIVINIAYNSEEVSQKTYKDDSEVEVFEYQGIKHFILRNNELYTTTWFVNDIKCSIAIDCQEDILYRILRSIYVMEDE